MATEGEKIKRGGKRSALYVLVPLGFVLIILVLMFTGWFANPNVDVPVVDDQELNDNTAETLDQ